MYVHACVSITLQLIWMRHFDLAGRHGGPRLASAISCLRCIPKPKIKTKNLEKLRFEQQEAQRLFAAPLLLHFLFTALADLSFPWLMRQFRKIIGKHFCAQYHWIVRTHTYIALQVPLHTTPSVRVLNEVYKRFFLLRSRTLWQEYVASPQLFVAPALQHRLSRTASTASPFFLYMVHICCCNALCLAFTCVHLYLFSALLSTLVVLIFLLLPVFPNRRSPCGVALIAQD